MNSQAQLSAAQQLASSGAGAAALQSGGDKETEDDDDIPELEAPEDDGPVDETGVDPKDIDLVIQQVGCSRAKAVKVLKESGGDLINASESLVSFIWLEILISVQSWPPASKFVFPHVYFYVFQLHDILNIHFTVPPRLYFDQRLNST